MERRGLARIPARSVKNYRAPRREQVLERSASEVKPDPESLASSEFRQSDNIGRERRKARARAADLSFSHRRAGCPAFTPK